MCQSVLHLLSFELTPRETWLQVKSKHHSVKWKLTSSLRQLPYLSCKTRVRGKKRQLCQTCITFERNITVNIDFIFLTVWLDGSVFVNNEHIIGEMCFFFYLFKTRSIRLWQWCFFAQVTVLYCPITDTYQTAKWTVFFSFSDSST